MGDHQFHTFTERLASPRTRRDTLRALGQAIATASLPCLLRQTRPGCSPRLSHGRS